jgi:hypothetical protein
VTSIRIRGSVSNPDDQAIDALTLNGISIYDSLDASDKFASTCTLAQDTETIIVAVKSGSNTRSDTVKIIRQAVSKSGLSKISGVLYRDDTGGRKKALAKIVLARNAQGIERTVSSIIPISGADVMFYDANSMNTAADTAVQTDTSGEWSAELPPGSYFVFAVYFDRENLEIVTAALPNVEAIADKETNTDTTTAITDDVKPMMMTFCDAISSDSSGLFIAGNLPQGLPIVMTFSEPMNRISAGDSMSGIVLGPTAVDSVDLPLLDTVAVDKIWSPTGKELRMVPHAKLTVGMTYKVYVPNMVKDLALNKLTQAYTGIAKVIAATDLPPFAVAMTMPKSGDTIPLGYPAEIIFTRPVDVLSLNRNWSMTCTDTSVPLVKGFFDVNGTSAKLTVTTLLKQGARYTLAIKAGTRSLFANDSLGNRDTSITVTIKPADQFQQKTGDTSEIALWCERTMGAYVAGDLETFSQAFHAQLEAIDISPRDQGVLCTLSMQRDKFLEMRRADISQDELLMKYGIICPKWYYVKDNTMWKSCWKLQKHSAATGTFIYFEDLGSTGGMGMIPRVYRPITNDTLDITDSVRYFDRGLIYRNDTLHHIVDMSSAFIDQNTRDNDPRIFGKLLAEQTDVETTTVFMDVVRTFTIKNVAVSVPGAEAQVMMEMVQERKYRDNKRPMPMPPDKIMPDVEKSVMAIQMKVIKEAGRWYVIQLLSKSLFSGDAAVFTANSVKTSDYQIQNFAGTKPIDLVMPAQKATGIQVPIILKWKKPATIVGGYLVAISNEMSGGNKGLLIYTRDTTISIAANCAVTGGTVLNIDPKNLPVPLPRFSMRLDSLTKSDSAIYDWKVVGIADTMAATVSAANLRIIADSDFGAQRGLGIFTLLSAMPNISATITQPATTPSGTTQDMFSDRDGDFFPDWMEKAFMTNPGDAGDYPNFVLDSDLDGYADFLEERCNGNPNDSAIHPVDNPKNGIPDTLERRPEWNPVLAKDDDKDGFPNEIEVIYGSDPWNSSSKPAKIIRPSLPTATWYSMVEIPAPNAPLKKKVKFTISSDTSVVIDTAELDGVSRFGYPLPKKLKFLAGEWVFFVPISAGPNFGKLYKFRFWAQPPKLQGNVDLADTMTLGGPQVGQLWGTSDSTVNLSTQTNQPSTNPGMQPMSGQINLGPPPAEVLKRAAGSSALAMMVNADTINNWAEVKVIPDSSADTAKALRAYWQPGMWPALRFSSNAPIRGKNIFFDGNLYKSGDTLIMSGPMWIDSSGVKSSYQFTLLIRNWVSVRNPQGVWRGWYAKNTQTVNPQNSGPLPYIGVESGVTSALTAANNKGLVGSDSGLDTTKVYTILRTIHNGQEPWKAFASCGTDSGEFFLVEKTPGNLSEIMTVTLNGKTYVVLGKASMGPGGGNPTGACLFQGDSVTIVQALQQTNGRVMVQAQNQPQLREDTVVVTSLQKRPDGMGGTLWAVKDASKSDVFFAIAADPMNKQNLAKDGFNLVIVYDMNSAPQPPQQQNLIYFTGDTTVARTVLQSVNGNVQVFGPAPYATQVNISTMKLWRDTVKNISIVAVRGMMDTSKLYGLLCDSASQQTPFKDMNLNRVAVKEIPIGPQQPQQNQPVPYAGDSVTAAAALAANNKVWVLDPAPFEVIINPATLRSQPNGAGGRNWVVAEQGGQNRNFILAADSKNPQILLKDPQNRVQVLPMQNNPTGPVPFAGDSMTIVNSLTASTNQVTIPGPTPAAATVNPATLKHQADGKGGFAWVIQEQGGTRNFIFLGDAMNPMNLSRDPQGKPLVADMAKQI